MNCSGKYDIYSLNAQLIKQLYCINIGGYTMGSGSGLTNAIYDNIINKSDLATAANLNSLSTNPTLSINNLKNASTS